MGLASKGARPYVLDWEGITMAQWIKAQVSLQDISGLPRDRYVNVFNLYHPSPDALTPIQQANVITALGHFYRTMGAYLHPAIDPATSEVALYDMSLPKGSPPIKTGPLQVTGAGATFVGTPMPTELAACLTLSGQPFSTELNTKILRGRIYIGPLNTSAVQALTTGAKHSRVADEFAESVVTAGIGLATALAAENMVWCVYSPTRGYLLPVSKLSVDDAWDIQRRRGDEPTTSTFSAGSDITPLSPAGGPILATPHGPSVG